MHLVIYFIDNNMFLDVSKESTTLIQIVNDKKFNFLEFIERNKVRHSSPQINFLCDVLELTIKYPQVETYLKNILNYFTIGELENSFNGRTILHYMCQFPFNISLNAFEIIINCGININIKHEESDTTAHKFLRNQCNGHTNNILNLLIKYGVDFNIMNSLKLSALDILTLYQKELNEETKNYITSIIDFGGKTNHLIKNDAAHDFIECYKLSSIKPAIKNETKI